MSVIKLQSAEGVNFETDIEVAKCFGTIRTMIEECGLDDEQDGVVPLPNVTSDILERVIKWAEHHKVEQTEDDDKKTEDNYPVQTENVNSDDISTWDADFLNIDRDLLFQLILAANYLDIKSLMNAACKTAANRIKGKSPEEISLFFNGNND